MALTEASKSSRKASVDFVWDISGGFRRDSGAFTWVSASFRCFMKCFNFLRALADDVGHAHCACLNHYDLNAGVWFKCVSGPFRRFHKRLSFRGFQWVFKHI